MNTAMQTAISILLVIPFPLALAQDASTEPQWIEFDAQAYAGYGYDSNVSVSEIDTNTGEGDSALYAKGKVKASITPHEKWQLNTSAQYALTEYNDYSVFNLAITTLSAEAVYKADWAKVALHHYSADAKLDDSDYLTYRQTGLSVGRAWQQKGYWRLSVDNISKIFVATPERDSDANALRSDVFWFNEAQAFWQFGFTFQQEDAQDNTFDYTSYLADVAYTTPLTWLHKDTEFTLSYHYETRDYAGAREGGIGRNDHRQRIKAVIDYPVSRHVDVMLSTQYGNYSSTTDSADYKETLAELGIKLYF